MRTIVHVSDLHFGRVNSSILGPLLAAIQAARPDLVAVSGDLTQRARTEEFIAAQNFLSAIPFKKIIVPGNHDVPLYNVFSRFVRRLTRYQRFITTDLAPFFVDNEIAVAGVNTARALTVKDGRINRKQMAELRACFEKVTGDQIKIVVTHHPFDLPEGVTEGRIVGRAQQAMEVFAKCGVDLLLAGHFHIGHSGPTTARFRIPGFSAIVVSSGTTASTRGRGQANSFNVIRTEPNRIQVERWEWQMQRGAFERATDQSFDLTSEGWWAADAETVRLES